jgi:hypothetical protein
LGKVKAALFWRIWSSEASPTVRAVKRFSRERSEVFAEIAIDETTGMVAKGRMGVDIADDEEEGALMVTLLKERDRFLGNERGLKAIDRNVVTVIAKADLATVWALVILITKPVVETLCWKVALATVPLSSERSRISSVVE